MGCVQSSGAEEAALADEKEAVYESDYITVVVEDDVSSEDEEDDGDDDDENEGRSPGGPVLVQDGGEQGARDG